MPPRPTVEGDLETSEKGELIVAMGRPWSGVSSQVPSICTQLWNKVKISAQTQAGGEDLERDFLPW